MSRFDPCSTAAKAIGDERMRKLDTLRQMYASATLKLGRRRARTPAQRLCDEVAEVVRKRRQA